MTISMYRASVPVFIRMLENLAAILQKAEQHAQAKKIDPGVLIDSRLYPDMFPLAKQVQIAADAAKGGAARLAQLEPPSCEDNEKTLGELAVRCGKTIEYLKTLKPEQIDGSEDRTITWQTRRGTKSMQGIAYLLNHVLPNFYFHITTAYGILRHSGLEIGKRDYLGET